MNLDSQTGVRIAQMVALTIVVVVVTLGAYEFLHLVGIIDRLN